MKKVIFIAAALCALAACNKEVIVSPSTEVGYLSFGLSADDVIVETKTEAAELDAFHIKYSDVTTTYGQLKNSVIPINIGDYIVEAYNYTETEAETGNGYLRLYDSETVTVSANQTATADLQCTPYSSEVTLTYSSAFSTKYPNPVFTLTKGGRTLNLNTTDKYYFNNTPNGTVSVTYSLKANGESSATKEIFGGTLTLSNACSLNVNVDIVTTTGELAFTLTASDILTGQTNTITVNPYTGEATTSGNVNNPQA